jgi:hypothetical protein
MSQKYHIVADGFSRIRAVSHYQEIYQPSLAEQRSLDGFVSHQREQAQSHDGQFFDGNLIGVYLNSIVSEGSVLSFTARTIKYSQHAGLFRNKADSGIQAMYVNAIVITRDNRIVFGTTQFTEADYMGKMSVPAGALECGPDGWPSPGAQIYRELSEEIGFAADYHLSSAIIPGWINGMSCRENNYHLTTSFIVPLKLTENEMQEYFRGWKAAQDSWISISHAHGEKTKTEFKDLIFVPNDPYYLANFIEEQDCMGSAAHLLGKSLDVIEEWVTQYKCNPETLLESRRDGTQVYLPQPLVARSK